LSRLIWITIAAMLLVLLLRASPDYFAWDYFFNGGERQQAEPRTVVARGSLAEDEQSTIALFENSRDAVVFLPPGNMSAMPGRATFSLYRAAQAPGLSGMIRDISLPIFMSSKA